MTREYDAVEEALIQQAATEALNMINSLACVGGVTKFIESGDTVFRLHLKIVKPKPAPDIGWGLDKPDTDDEDIDFSQEWEQGDNLRGG